MALENEGSNPSAHPMLASLHKNRRPCEYCLCAYSSADKSTGLRNRGSWVRIPLGALSASPSFANILPQPPSSLHPMEGKLNTTSNPDVHISPAFIDWLNLYAYSQHQRSIIITQATQLRNASRGYSPFVTATNASQRRAWDSTRAMRTYSR